MKYDETYICANEKERLHFKAEKNMGVTGGINPG